ncbi:MAG: ABC transporter permease [Muribaculaceae bacterium]|nr:ABC transporter permease [Muribaculaceae bacterium]
MKNALGLVISREYLERVKRKSFIISTLLVPLFMVIIMVAPAVLMLMSEPENKVIAVIDDTGVVAPRLHGEGEVQFVNAGEPLDSARNNADYSAILVIGEKAIERPDANITLYSHGSLTLISSSYISGQISKAIEDVRLKAYNIENLRTIMEEVKVDMSLPVIDIDKSEDTATSAGLSYALALGTDMILYMFILIYGQMVMTSIIEEKSNRVLELVVSSVKPTQLMLGKILGIGLVAITQILIWGAVLAACSAWLVPFVANMPEAAEEAEIAAALSQLGDAGYMFSIFAWMIVFVIGGYLFYSSIFAAIGSAVDNIQDASQLTSVATMPIIIGVVASMSVINNPNSTLAFWLSMIPFTSPMTMMARLPFGVPVWETALSLLLLYAFTLFMVWICAKIYRVGIFMYGKKPSVAEVIRWARYK